DMFQFAGVNVFPSAIENVIRKVDCFSNEYQIIVPAMGSGKRLKIRVEPATDRVTSKEMKKALDQFMEAFKYSITFTPEVEVAEIGTLPRFELKAKRVIRDV
ncbi:MAG: phenylacetate--CoA ligase family protein, partial [Deltaproteobacteria bacterium]|nr:phenylacetate--CoA ligase family protein [Deltaproteobacteria bacterium]